MPAEDPLIAAERASRDRSDSLGDPSRDETTRSVVHGTKAMAVAQAVTLVSRLLTNVVLARILVPSDFGVVAVATVVSLLLDQLRDLGTGSALIQQKRLTSAVVNTVFYLNMLLGLVLAAAVALLSPLLATLMGEPRAAPVLAAFAVVTLITSSANVHHALLRRDLRFREVSLIGVFAAAATSVVSISLAFAGLGVWALALGVTAGSLTGVGFSWHFDRWRPGWPRELTGLGTIMSYSSNLLFVNLLTFVFMQADKVLVSRFLGAGALGIYAMAQRILTYPLASLASVVNEVVFPAMSRQQDDQEALQVGFVRASAVVAFVTFPLMAGLAAVASPLVHLTLGHKWGDLVPLIWILAPVGALQSVTLSASQLLLMAKGRTDVLLRWSLASSGVTVVGYLIGVHFGLVGLAVAFAITTVILTPIGLHIAFRQVELPLATFGKALAPTAVHAVATAGVALLVQLAAPTSWNQILVLALAVLAGAMTYLGLIAWRRPQALLDALRVMRSRRQPIT